LTLISPLKITERIQKLEGTQELVRYFFELSVLASFSNIIRGKKSGSWEKQKEEESYLFRAKRAWIFVGWLDYLLYFDLIWRMENWVSWSYLSFCFLNTLNKEPFTISHLTSESDILISLYICCLPISAYLYWPLDIKLHAYYKLIIEFILWWFVNFFQDEWRMLVSDFFNLAEKIVRQELKNPWNNFSSYPYLSERSPLFCFLTRDRCQNI